MSEPSNVESTGFKTELQKTADQFENLMTPTEEVEEQQEEQVEEVEEEAVEDVVEDDYDIDEDIEETEEEVELDEQESFEEEEQPQVYSVKIDGQEQEVTLQELQQGYSRQQDYTRKTQELSQQRKDFEAQQAELAKKDAIYKELLPRMEQTLESDPIAYVREKDVWNEKKEKFKAVQAEQQRLRQEQLTSQQAEIQKAVELGNQKLLEAVPEWKDAEVALKEKQSIAKYAMDVLGYSQDEINQVYDYRALLGLRGAWLHHQTGKAIKKKPVEKAPARVGKPGSANKPKTATPLKKAKQRLAKSGKLRDAAKVFENLID